MSEQQYEPKSNIIPLEAVYFGDPPEDVGSSYVLVGRDCGDAIVYELILDDLTGGIDPEEQP